MAAVCQGLSVTACSRFCTTTAALDCCSIVPMESIDFDTVDSIISVDVHGETVFNADGDADDDDNNDGEEINDDDDDDLR